MHDENFLAIPLFPRKRTHRGNKPETDVRMKRDVASSALPDLPKGRPSRCINRSSIGSRSRAGKPSPRRCPRAVYICALSEAACHSAVPVSSPRKLTRSTFLLGGARVAALSALPAINSERDVTDASRDGEHPSLTTTNYYRLSLAHSPPRFLHATPPAFRFPSYLRSRGRIMRVPRGPGRKQARLLALYEQSSSSASLSRARLDCALGRPRIRGVTSAALFYIFSFFLFHPRYCYYKLHFA